MSYTENIRTFVRVYELGSMCGGARSTHFARCGLGTDFTARRSPARALFQRTTQMLNPTEQGRMFYSGAVRILDAIEEAEAQVQDITQSPRGSIYVAAPLGIGRRFIAPAVPDFKEQYPLIDVRLRLSDRSVDLTAEGLDVAFFLGTPKDSTFMMRKIADCPRLLCAAPSYLQQRGTPSSPKELTDGTHDCLNLRFPGASEFQWPLVTKDGMQRFAVKGPFSLTTRMC